MTATTKEPVVFERITMQKQADGSVIILGKWPRHARMTVELLGVGGMITVTLNGQIMFDLRNSWGLYRLYEKQDGQYISIERVAWGDKDP